MDMLYACALKRTPNCLAVILSILPATEFVVGFGTLILEFVLGQQWVKAITNLFVFIALVANQTTYNVAGVCLIRILRKHQQTGNSAPSDDISGSKSASPFDIVIAKTMRSMFLLTVPSLAASVMYLVIGVGLCNNHPNPPYDPDSLGWNVIANIFVQLVLGLLFTRVAWISKEALDAEIMTKTTANISSGNLSKEGFDQKRSGGASRADLKARASQLSQPATSRPSHSQAESAAAVVAVTVVGDSTSECLPAPSVEIVSIP